MSTGFSSPSSTDQRPGKAKRVSPVIDAEQVQQQWLSQFEELEDPRGLQGREHAFLNIVLIAIKRDDWWSHGVGGY